MKTILIPLALLVAASLAGCACHVTAHEIGFKRLLGLDVAPHPTGSGPQTTTVLPAYQVQDKAPVIVNPPMMPAGKMVMIQECNGCNTQYVLTPCPPKQKTEATALPNTPNQP